MFTKIMKTSKIERLRVYWLIKRKCNATISLPISIKHIIRGPNGGLILITLGAQGEGQK